MKLTKEQKQLIEKIKKLKKEKNAVILVHNYQKPEIYEVADFIGDSLELSRKAANAKEPVIVFCGVKFMAETAKILSPDKTVLLPAKDAGCPMADMMTAEQLKEFKKKYPNAAVACYVNSSAKTKAECDICCTSTNAVEVINSLDKKEVIMVPDKNLAAYVQSKTKKKIIPWNGFCHVHQNILPEKARLAKEKNPDAILIAHPECPQAVLKYADLIFSTGSMTKFARENLNKKIILGTEVDMINRVILENPNNKYCTIGETCFNMKKTNLKNVLEALEKNQHEITIPEEIREKAESAIRRMLDVKREDKK